MTSPEAQTQPPQQQASAEHPEGKQTGGKLLHLRTARVPIPYVTPGDKFPNVRKAAPASKATSLLPSPRKLVLYGVLGGMTAAGAIGWPVAVAVGAATEVITREQAARQHQGHEHAERTETATPPRQATA
ncbi:hypothetical protein ABZ892_01780 [Streptomyces sp. NPDC046924]|uniref:hypothetical protein n=1 Tax=Streptomyces sp. NPDC046924 TaxID=3155136 RepID=UPI0033D0BCF5